MIINRKERFATEGIRFMRHNPDGSIPTPERMLGFSGTINLSGITPLSLTVKIDNGTPETKTVTLSSSTAATPSTVASALNTANFTDMNFSVDSTTQRLKAEYDGTGSPKVIQITGALAAALDFGQSRAFGGNGLQLISFFDDQTISIGLPKDIKDKEEIDIEGAKGTITRMVIGAMLQGLSPVVTLKEKDYELLELIQGGKLDRTNNTYDPPASSESEHPTFFAEIYSPIYSQGVNKMEDHVGYEKLLLRSMIGMEGDVPIEAKAWAQYAFNLSATDYTDENGTVYPSYQEATLTNEEFIALNVKDV